MRLNAMGTGDSPLNCLDFRSRNCRHSFSTVENHVDSRSRYNLQLAFKASAHKNVAREKRERKNLGPIFPAARGFVKWQEDLKSFGSKHFLHRFLMLVAGVDSPP